jgi:hypothetical protein
MSSAATVTRKIYDGYDGSTYVIPAEQTPTASTLVPTMWRQIFALAAGTYELANLKKGQVVLLDIEGAVTLNNAAAVAIGTFASGDFVEVTATTDSGDFRYRRLANDVPGWKFNTSAAASGVVPTGAVWSGANEVFWQNTTDGAMAVTTPEAADWIDALQLLGMPRNMRFILTIVNRGDNTITITGGTDVTITGEATIATLVTRRYLVSVDDVGLTVVMRSVDKGTIET